VHLDPVRDVGLRDPAPRELGVLPRVLDRPDATPGGSARAIQIAE
jgi:hypothetical protein